MIITFLGNDGSGKTTLAKETYNFFKSLGFDVVYHHEYQYALLKFLFRLIGNKRKDNMVDTMVFGTKKSWKYQLWPVLVWMDIYLQSLYFRVFRKQTIILLDRYIYDHYRSFEYYLDRLHPITKWLYLHFPRPDIPMLLWVEPAIAYERKKETHIYEPSYYQIQLDRYLELASKMNIPTINTNQSIIESKRAILQLFFQNKQFSDIFIKHCSHNRILSWAIKEYALDSISHDCQRLGQLADKKEQRIVKTLNFINTIPVDKLIYKSHTNIRNPYVNDIDLLVSNNDISTFLDFVRKEGGNIVSNEANKFECSINGLDKIEPHLAISWLGIAYVDDNFLWQNVRQTEMLSVPIYVPNYEAELLVHAAHIIFSHSFVRFNDYLYLRYLLSQNLDMNKVYSQAAKYGWDEPLKKLMLMINDQKYPYFLPLTFVISSHLSKIKHDIKAKTFSIKELVTYVRDVGMFAFWRIRYKAKNKMPFEVDLEADL